MSVSISDEDLRSFYSMPNVTEMMIAGSRELTGEGFGKLRHLRLLDYLNLTRSGITDDGLGAIASLRRMECLSVGETKITDEGLRHVVDIRGLKTLDLSRTNVTDKGLATLRSDTLEWLALDHTKVTAEGVRILAEKLPSLKYMTIGGTPAAKTLNTDLFEGLKYGK